MGEQIIKHVQFIEMLLPALQQDLDKAKRDPVTLARAFVVLHRINERMLSDEKSFKPFRALWKDAKEKVVPEALEQAGLENVPLSEGFRVGTSTRTVASIKPGEKDKAYVWLIETERGDVIKETVNASTLSALANELAERNLELPEAWFNVEHLNNTSVTKI